MRLTLWGDIYYFDCCIRISGLEEGIIELFGFVCKGIISGMIGRGDAVKECGISSYL